MDSQGAGPSRWNSRAAWLGVLFLALLVHSPSLFAGYLADDYGVQLVLDGRIESPTWKPWSLYDFGSYAEASAQSVRSGAFPWWVDADWRVRFLRPLSSLSLWLDHALFGSNAFLAHAENLALFAALLVAARRLYRRLGLGAGTALVAVLVLACDGGALMPVGWLANRNSLLEGLCAVLATDAALRARERGSIPLATASVLLALAAVGAKESGVHVLGVVSLVFLGFARAGSARLWPFALLCVLLAVAYPLAYAALGYGSNVRFYPMPWTEPTEFALRALQTFACAPLAMLSPFSLDLFVLQPAWTWALVSLAVALGVPAVHWILRRLRGEPASGLLFAWGLLALLPQAGAPPSDRLLFTALIPWAALVATYLARTVPAARRAALPRAERAFALGVAAALVLAGPLQAGIGVNFARGSAALRRAIVEADTGSAADGPRDVFLLQASPSALVALSPQSVSEFCGGDPDVRLHALQGGHRALRWTRTSERVAVLESRDEPFLESPFEGVFLTAAPAPNEAREWRRGGFTVRGTPDGDGALRRFSVELESSLDLPRWRFLAWRAGRLTHVPPPAIGESLELPRGFKDPWLP